MNLFSLVSSRARTGQFNTLPCAPYLASPEFEERTAFHGETGIADKLAILHFMLRQIALDPREVEEGLRFLKGGYIALTFLDFANPIAPFALFADDPRVHALTCAVHENINSSRGRAARLKLKWYEPCRAWKGVQREEALMAEFTASLPWPKPTELDDINGTSRATYIELCDKQIAKRKALRETRQRRLHALCGNAAPAIATWAELLVAISTEVLATRH